MINRLCYGALLTYWLSYIQPDHFPPSLSPLKGRIDDFQIDAHFWTIHSWVGVCKREHSAIPPIGGDDQSLSHSLTAKLKLSIKNFRDLRGECVKQKDCRIVQIDVGNGMNERVDWK